MPRNLFGQPISARGEILGCDRCSLDGARKIKGLTRIKGRRAMLWAGAPGRSDDAKGLELSGSAGDLLWEAAATARLGRADFDVQNVVRCRPTDEEGRDREPSKRELQCCSVHNDRARELNAGAAVAHLVLGDAAGAQLLGGAFRKDRPVFWHDPWDAYVVLDAAPEAVLARGGKKAGLEYHLWRERFRAVRAAIDFPGRWGYVRSRGYRAVRTQAEFGEMERALRAEAKAGRRVSVDIEDGDDHQRLLVVGFGVGRFGDLKDFQSWTGGRCWSVVVDHPEAGYEPTQARWVKGHLKRVLEDPSIRKALHNGSYDSNQTRRLLGARLAGYDYDTMYATYLRHSFLRSCSLENLTYRFFPEFADYKDTVAEWMDNLTKAPLDRLVLRNCGDCDVTKRLEDRIRRKVSYALVQVYIHAGFTLDDMETRGPLLDWEQHAAGAKAVPEMIEKLDRMLEHISGRPGFDCDSPPQVAWLVYDHLGLPQTEAGRSTVKEVLELLAAQTGHPALEIIQRRRAIGKIKGTYLDGFERSARIFGHLHTIWWLTGAVTGRLRSGRGDKAEAEGILNLQNLHGNPKLQNMIVSDENWRLALEE